MKVTVILIIIGALGTVLKGLEKGTGRVGNRKANRDYRNSSITEIGQNADKSPEVLRRLVVTQPPVKDLATNAGVKNLQERTHTHISNRFIGGT